MGRILKQLKGQEEEKKRAGSTGKGQVGQGRDWQDREWKVKTRKKMDRTGVEKKSRVDRTGKESLVSEKLFLCINKRRLLVYVHEHSLCIFYDF